MNRKKIIVASVIALAGGVITYLVSKGEDIANTLPHLEILPTGWPKSIKIGLNQTSFKIDLSIANKTANDFSVDSGAFATLQRVALVYSGQIIAIADLELTQLSVPAYSSTIINDVPFAISTDFIINNGADLKNVISKMSTLSYIDVMGKQIIVES